MAVEARKPTTFVYVDGFNLYYRKLQGTPHKWLDLRRFAELMLPKNDVREIYYFTARITPRPGDPEQPQRQQTYLRALATIGVRIVFGTFQSKPKQRPLLNHIPAAVEVIAELKAPAELTRPVEGVAIDPVDLVNRALDDSSHQRKGRDSVLLIQGGFRTPVNTLKRLASAWSAALAKPSRMNVAAGIVFTLGAHPNDIPVRMLPRATRPGMGVHERFAVMLDPRMFDERVFIRVGRNPRYASREAPVIGLRDPAVGIRLPS